jgi:hypothetical protein
MPRPLDALIGHQTITSIDSGVESLDARCAAIGSDGLQGSGTAWCHGSKYAYLAVVYTSLA